MRDIELPNNVGTSSISDITWAVNSTPGKCLGYKTPAGAFLENPSRCT